MNRGRTLLCVDVALKEGLDTNMGKAMAIYALLGFGIDFVSHTTIAAIDGTDGPLMTKGHKYTTIIQAVAALVANKLAGSESMFGLTNIKEEKGIYLISRFFGNKMVFPGIILWQVASGMLGVFKK